MDALSNFFTLRPVFTFFGLKIVWYIFLLHVVVELYVELTAVSQLLQQRGISWLTWLPNSAPLILGLIAQIAVVRLLLEVAATILLSRPRSET